MVNFDLHIRVTNQPSCLGRFRGAQVRLHQQRSKGLQGAQSRLEGVETRKNHQIIEEIYGYSMIFYG